MAVAGGVDEPVGRREGLGRVAVVADRCSAGVQEAGSREPGTAVFQGEEASQLAGGRDGRWAWGQLAPQSGRRRYLRLTLWPGPCGESVKPDPGNRVKVSEPWLDAISTHR